MATYMYTLSTLSSSSSLSTLLPPLPTSLSVNCTTGETNINERSSRSHAVLSIAVESRVKDGDGTVKVSSLVGL